MNEALHPMDLEKAMKEFDADRDFIKEILHGFLKNVARQIVIIRDSLSKSDAETIRREAHSIKGGAANLCADDLSQAALMLERLGKSGDLNGGTDMLGRLENEYRRLEEFGGSEL